MAPVLAHADAIIPYVVVPWGQALLLPIVVIIEGLILVASLGGGVMATMLQSLVANVASTIVGGLIYVGTMTFAQPCALANAATYALLLALALWVGSGEWRY